MTQGSWSDLVEIDPFSAPPNIQGPWSNLQTIGAFGSGVPVRVLLTEDGWVAVETVTL